MKLKDSALIYCRKELVWKLLNDTRTRHKWNPQVQEILPVFYGSRREGYKYTITQKMKGKNYLLMRKACHKNRPMELIIACNNPELNQENVVHEI